MSLPFPFKVSDFFEPIKKHIKWYRNDLDKDMYSSQFMLREQGTFKLCCGRKTGHTTLAIKILEEYPDSYLILSKDRTAMITKQIAADKCEIDLSKRIISTKDINKLTGKPNKIGEKIVVIDNASWFSEKDLNNIYNCNPEFVVMLQ